MLRDILLSTSQLVIAKNRIYCLSLTILAYIAKFYKFYREIAEKKAKKIAIAFLRSRLFNFAIAIVQQSFDQMEIADRDREKKRSPITHALIMAEPITCKHFLFVNILC